MKALITGSIVAMAFGITAAAQDSTVTTQTKVSGDDARAVTMRGCLQAGSTGFQLQGAVAASGEDLKSKTTVKTDVDGDDTKVKSQTATKIDDTDKSVGTAGTVTTYAVMPKDGVNLVTHAGQEVEITGVVVDARKGGDNDAEVKIQESTKTDVDGAPDAKAKSTTKAEVPRGATAQLMAMSVKSLGRSCASN
jgi:hypothetical protein